MSTEQPSSIERTGSKVYRYFVVVLTLLVALYLIIQGAKLLSLGGTSYYLIAGIAYVAIAILYAMKKPLVSGFLLLLLLQPSSGLLLKFKV